MTDKEAADRTDLMRDLHSQAWDMWHQVREGGEYDAPDFSVLTYSEMDYLQHWDMPGLPYAAHQALLEEMGKRWDATEPCEKCGARTPK